MKDFSCKCRHQHIKNTVPWINDDILKIMKERDSALKINGAMTDNILLC